MKSIKLISLLFLTFLLLHCTPEKKDVANNDWIPLFNGENLTGWETFLSFQPGSTNEEVLGVNNDPDNIFSVVNGSIRIDGRIWGALTTVDSYENYHLKLEFRWGEKKYAPRENSLRDSGLLYHCVGAHGAQSGHWMRSHESQIMEGSCGDYHSLDGVSIDILADTVLVDESKQLKYNAGSSILKGVNRRVIKSDVEENPLGEWNTMELIVIGSDIIHKVNDKVVLKASNSSQLVNGEKAPLTKGKIQLQSEGAEIFYRNIIIKHLE